MVVASGVRWKCCETSAQDPRVTSYTARFISFYVCALFAMRRNANKKSETLNGRNGSRYPASSSKNHIVQSICKSLYHAIPMHIAMLIWRFFQTIWFWVYYHGGKQIDHHFFLLKLYEKSTILEFKMNEIAPITQWTKSKVLGKIVCDFSLLILIWLLCCF